MKSSLFPFGMVLGVALLVALSPCRLIAASFAPAEAITAEDEKILLRAGLSIKGSSLLAAVRKHTLTAETRKQVDGLIARLGADSFAERENASKELFALGRVALRQLREARKHEDAEIARRAKLLTERIERDPSRYLPAAAVRLLSLRKPAGSVAALLAYLPFAEDENLTAQVQASLTVLAMRQGKLDPALLRAAIGPDPTLRAVAAEALVKGGGAEGCAEGRRLLKDAVPAVRLRAALALAMVREKEGVPVLIDLLPVLADEHIGQVEDVLYQLAGDTAPKESLGAEPAERKKCRDAWAAWWKVNAARADLARLTDCPQYGFTLICENFKNRVYEIDRRGKERWSIGNIPNPLDAVVLPGNRVLIAECHANRVTERDFTGKILWQQQIPMPTCVQRLPNGHTFIATYKGTILEVDRAGKEIYTIKNIPGGVKSAFRSRQDFIAYLTQKGECVLVDTAGKRLKSFDTHHAFTEGSLDWIDGSSHGGILITQCVRGKVVEYTAEGKKTIEVDAPQATTATSLPNGHLLVADHQGRRVYELNRAGKIVWEHKGTGNVYRARRR